MADRLTQLQDAVNSVRVPCSSRLPSPRPEDGGEAGASGAGESRERVGRVRRKAAGGV